MTAADSAKDIQVVDNRDESRYEIRVDGDLAGFAEYDEGEGIRDYNHTVTQPEFRGQGLAGIMVHQLLDDALAAGINVQPSCSYVAKVMADEPDKYAKLLRQ